MKISAFTIIKNAVKFQYPIIESIKSLEPYVDEYVINLGDSEDETEELILKNFGNNPKFIIFKSVWEGKDQGMAFFRNQTNLALDKCAGDWCFYLQADECIHDDDAKRFKSIIEDVDRKGHDAILFRFLHFEKNYSKLKKTYSEGFDAYGNEVRLIKNNKLIKSVGDAMGFGGVKSPVLTDLRIFHYGYVKSPQTMLEKKLYLKEFYFGDPAFTDEMKIIENGKIRSDGDKYKYSRQLNDFTGTHPSSMKERIELFNQTYPELCQ
jgi:glycosyltransferase involved in cell wall biosynthesis